MSEEIEIEEMPEQTVTIEQAIQLYERRLQEQSGIIFSLVAKMGGEVVLTGDDLLLMPEYNTVSADNTEDGGIKLTLSRIEREQ
jgi:hypothetical protein